MTDGTDADATRAARQAVDAAYAANPRAPALDVIRAASKAAAEASPAARALASQPHAKNVDCKALPKPERQAKVDAHSMLTGIKPRNGVKTAAGGKVGALAEECRARGIAEDCCLGQPVLRGKPAALAKEGRKTNRDLTAIYKDAFPNEPIPATNGNLIHALLQAGKISPEEAVASSPLRHSSIKLYMHTAVPDESLQDLVHLHVVCCSKVWAAGGMLLNLTAMRVVDGADLAGSALPPATPVAGLFDFFDENYVSKVFLCAMGEASDARLAAAKVHPDDMAATAFLRPTKEDHERWLRHQPGTGRSAVATRMALDWIGNNKAHLRNRGWPTLMSHLAYECPALGGGGKGSGNQGLLQFVREGGINNLDRLSGDAVARPFALAWRDCFGVRADGTFVAASAAPGAREYPSGLQAASKHSDFNAKDVTIFATVWAHAAARQQRQQHLQQQLSQARAAAAAADAATAAASAAGGASAAAGPPTADDADDNADSAADDNAIETSAAPAPAPAPAVTDNNASSAAAAAATTAAPGATAAAASTTEAASAAAAAAAAASAVAAADAAVVSAATALQQTCRWWWGKRYSLFAMPTAFSRVHAYIDKTIIRSLAYSHYQAAAAKFGTDDPSLAQVCGFDDAAFKTTRKKIRRENRKKYSGGYKRAQRARQRRMFRQRGRGRGSLPRAATVRSLLTDGVSCVLALEFKSAAKPYPNPYGDTTVRPVSYESPAYAEPARTFVDDPRRALVGVDLGRARPISAAVALRVPDAQFANEADMRRWAAGSTHKCLTRRRLIHDSKARPFRAWENARGEGDCKAARDALSASGGKGMGVEQLHAYLAVLSAHGEALSDELLDGPAAIQRAKWGMVMYRAKLAAWDRFGRALLEHRAPSCGSARAGGLSRKLLRVDVLLGDVDFASSGRGEDAVPTKSIWRKLARVVATHHLPVRFHAPQSEYRTTKCCCACGALTTAATTRLRRCVSAQCTGRGAGGGGDGDAEGGREGGDDEKGQGDDEGGGETARRAQLSKAPRFHLRRALGRPLLPAATDKASVNFGTATSTAPATCL